MTMSQTGNSRHKASCNKRGFTLIEVLLSVAILAICLAGVMEGYRNILGVYGRARLLTEGLRLLEEKMGEEEIKVRNGMVVVGSEDGKEGSLNWSVKTSKALQEGWYESEGKVWSGNETTAITLYRYVRQ